MKNYFNYLLNILFPRHCVICGKELDTVTVYPYPLCNSCIKTLNEVEEPRCSKCSLPLIEDVDECIRCKSSTYTFLSNYSLYNYRDWEVKELIYMYKFRKIKSLSYFFAEKLAELINNRYSGLSIVPVPTERKSMQEKGFDHIGLIAEILEKRYGIKIRRILKKRIRTEEQKGLGFTARMNNLKGSITIDKKNSVLLPVNEKKHLLLLDDIFTTGATAEECSKMLKKNGIGNISIVTIAID